MRDLRRSQVYIVNLDDDNIVGSEQGKTRPAVIISSDRGNCIKDNPIVMVSFITAEINKVRCTQVFLPKGSCGLKEDSKIMTEHIRTIDRQRLLSYVGTLPTNLTLEMNHKLAFTQGLI